MNNTHATTLRILHPILSQWKFEATATSSATSGTGDVQIVTTISILPTSLAESPSVPLLPAAQPSSRLLQYNRLPRSAQVALDLRHQAPALCDRNFHLDPQTNQLATDLTQMNLSFSSTSKSEA